jgi:hypothetical protein
MFPLEALAIELISEAPVTSIPTQPLEHVLTSPVIATAPPEAIRVELSNFAPVVVPFAFIAIAPPSVLKEA